MDFENNTNNGDNTGVVIDIQKINCYIEDQFNKMDTTMKNKIELIHPQINFYYNSFNLCIGKQGCGKTTLIIKELYKLSKVNFPLPVLSQAFQPDSSSKE